MFKWKPTYSVNIESIDVQHKALLEIGGELYSAMSNGQGSAVTGKLLDRLILYTVKHFKHEEWLMQTNKYPGFAAHKAQHDAMTAKVLNFQAELKAGRAVISVELLTFLKNWLIGHIQGSDRDYMPYVSQQTAA